MPVVPISAAKNQGVDELVRHAIHIAKYQERPGRQDFCDENDFGGAVHRCIHAVSHLIEDHAKLAGVPDKVVSKAKTYLRQFEAEAASPKAKKPEKDDQISLVDAGTDEVGRILRSTDINSLTPLEALNLLSELQQKARG